MLEVPRSTFYGWLKPRRFSSQPKSPANRLSAGERQAIRDLLFDPSRIDQSIYQIHFNEANQGRVIASLRSFYRVAHALLASGDRRPQAMHPKRSPPILVATAINQVWCWDITRIPGEVAGHHMFLFALIDLFSRFMVGWMLATKENASLATHFLRESLRNAQQEGSLQHLVTHSDRGGPMIAASTRHFLNSAGITVSYSRPRVSDDNPFIESLFKTVKYHPTYPGFFDHQSVAESWFTDFVGLYHHTPHKGLAGYTPHQAYTGDWIQAFHHRQRSLDDSYRDHASRFAYPPRAKPLPNLVSINVRRIKHDEHTQWPKHTHPFGEPAVHTPTINPESISTLISPDKVSDFP